MKTKNGKKIDYFKSFIKLDEISTLKKSEKVDIYIKTYPYMAGMEKSVFETENKEEIEKEILLSEYHFLCYKNGLLKELDIIKDEKVVLKNVLCKGQEIKFKNLSEDLNKKEQIIKIIKYGLNLVSEKSHIIGFKNNGVLYFLNNCNVNKGTIIENVYLTDKNINLNILLNQAHILEENDYNKILDFCKKSGNLSKLLFLLIKRPEIISNKDIEDIFECILTISKEYEYISKDILMNIAKLKQIKIENKKKFFIYAYVNLNVEEIVFLAEKNDLWLMESEADSIIRKDRKYQIINLLNNNDKSEEDRKIETIKKIARYKVLENKLNQKEIKSEANKSSKI